MKNRGGMFKGWRQVFNFTAMQNMKGPGFKISTIGITVFLFAVFFAINCIMANSQLKDSKKDADAVMDLEDTSIKTVYYTSDDEYSKSVLDTTIASIKDAVEIEFKEASDNVKESKISAEKGSIVMFSYTEKETVKFDFNISKEADVSEDDVDTFAMQFTAIVNNIKYSMAGLSQIQIAMVNSSENVYSEIVDIDDIDEEADIGVMVAEMVVPLIYTFVFYFMILMYTQSIQKLVVAEKTSKLMETLLTSVKPYAVIAGKVFAMAAIGIGQTVLWIVGGVLGYIVGDKVALKIYPEYSNIIGEIIDLMQTDSEIAFAPKGIIMALICIILGYLVYCVLGGLAGAVVSKIEDMSGAQMIFIIPTMIGYMASIFVPLMVENEVLSTIIRLVPIISPFIMPADLIIGNAVMWEGIASIAILLVSCFVLILITGKIYKNKVFNRG